eukprot:6198231-Pyramimonas_sp.AAC.1
MDVVSPEAYTSPEAGVLTRLFTRLVVDALNMHVYNAEIAGEDLRLVRRENIPTRTASDWSA